MIYFSHSRKEVVAISLLSSFILNIIVVKLFFPKPHDLLQSDTTPSHSPTHSRTNSECGENEGVKLTNEENKKSNGDMEPQVEEREKDGKDGEKLIPFASR